MSTGILDSRESALGRPSKVEAARVMAELHYAIEPGMVTVFRLEGPGETDRDPIKLLEVNRDTVTAGIMPLGFPPRPARGEPYGTIIVEVTPAEFDQLRSGTLRLPHDWQMVEEIAPPATAG
jgi:hypothetical protein